MISATLRYKCDYRKRSGHTGSSENLLGTKVERMKAFRDRQSRPNGIHILTFVTRELPDNVFSGYERYSVKRFYPNPLRYEICCEFGHTKN
jgi:hypothetical protein